MAETGNLFIVNAHQPVFSMNGEKRKTLKFGARKKKNALDFLLRFHKSVSLPKIHQTVLQNLGWHVPPKHTAHRAAAADSLVPVTLYHFLASVFFF